MLNSYRIAGSTFDFKRVITEKELHVIRSLRTVAIRKNSNSIHSEEEVMSTADIDTLLNFLSNAETTHFLR
jgi:hypothetical protein